MCLFISTVGDYIVVAWARSPRTKVSCNLVGTLQATQIFFNPTVKVEHLLKKNREVLHVSRVRSYAEWSVGNSAEMSDIADYTEGAWLAVDRTKDVRKTLDLFKVLISWKNLKTSGILGYSSRNFRERILYELRFLDAAKLLSCSTAPHAPSSSESTMRNCTATFQHRCHQNARHLIAGHFSRLHNRRSPSVALNTKFFILGSSIG